MSKNSNGKHRVLVLGAENKWLTVQFKNGEIKSFKTKHELSEVEDFLAGAEIDITVKGQGRGKERVLSLADNAVEKIVSDDSINSALEIKRRCDATEQICAEFMNLMFNDTCCEAQNRVQRAVEELCYQLEFEERLAEQEESLEMEEIIHSVEEIVEVLGLPDGCECAILGFGGLDSLLPPMSGILRMSADDLFGDSAVLAGSITGLVDNVFLPLLNERRRECCQQIEERAAALLRRS
ncbi:MAG: hypothetical protein LBR70_06770 [Lactobacillaceae bacterium]|jgi:hypothetical protein|nr:hypothetical protein [Lactobacillaceae bacterium]